MRPLGPGDIRVAFKGGDAWEVSLPRRKSAVRGRDGVRPRKLVHAASEAEAAEAGREAFAREETAYLRGLTMNLADWLLFFVDNHGYTSETARDYRNVVLRYVAPNFSKDIDEIQKSDLEGFYRFLMESGGRDGRGISPNTVRKLHTIICAAYGLINDDGVTQVNPTRSMKLQPRTNPEKRSLTEREYAKILNGLEAELGRAPADGAGVTRRNALFGAYLGMHVGARVGEVCAITRGDVRALEKAIRIEHSMSERGGLHRKPPKTESGKRTVTLDGGMFDMLRRHYEWQATYLSDAKRDSDGTPVCCTAEGSFIRPRDMSGAFKAFCAGVGVELKKGESFHILRHTHATLLLSNKVSVERVRERMGHSRVETTLGSYSHVMPGDDAETAADYGAIVERARKAGGFR